ncbi:MAG TPA: HPF/RaiA family ribosome-associated protein [Polyangiaceae bacterium]|nr:HPF/RaiA family ribosome-associated protein [Polyangiaceae bacterium]
MKIVVVFRGIEASDALREHVVLRAQRELQRFSDEVSSVVVRVQDINGPKGGIDKRCHVTVRGRAMAPVVIEAMSADPYSAAESGLERAARAVRREIARARGRRDDGFGRAS